MQVGSQTANLSTIFPAANGEAQGQRDRIVLGDDALLFQHSALKFATV